MLVILPSPIPELQHALLPFQSATSQWVCPNFYFSIVFNLDSHLSHLRSWEHVNEAFIVNLIFVTNLIFFFLVLVLLLMMFFFLIESLFYTSCSLITTCLYLHLFFCACYFTFCWTIVVFPKFQPIYLNEFAYTFVHKLLWKRLIAFFTFVVNQFDRKFGLWCLSTLLWVVHYVINKFLVVILATLFSFSFV